MAELPSGTVTFLVTDVEGSTALWERTPEVMQPALARHDTLVREVIQDRGGHVVKTMGDAFHAVFGDALDAVTAAIDAQHRLAAEPWPDARGLRVRMALHTGVTEERGGDYYGPPMNRVARLLSTGHGGQILLSEATAVLVRARLPADASLLDLGEHRLKDLTQPERVFQQLAPGLPTEFPPLRSLDALPNNLPRQLTSFVGREQEMAEVKRLLAATSLLTLVGTGGAGKTRLSLQVAADVLEAYRDGAWLVELAPLADPALVPQLVATALGVREQAGRPLMQTLQEQLRTRTLLLVLDNCEHLVAACAVLADGLLRACPNVRILATSREALGIAGETTWRVPSLSMPDPQRAGFGAADLAATLPQYEAVRLFIDRALAVSPRFAVTNQNAPAVAQICHRLDGIPLALELAAARVRVLSPEQIAARLDDRLRLLTGGSRTALPRQQTLRALVDWSYDLLSEQERTLLGRLSVFAGGWTLEAAEAVCAGEGIEELEILDLLAQLVDKSIVIAEPRADETRYRLLETLRQYARERLTATGDLTELQRRHAVYYADLAGKAAAEIMGASQTVWLDHLDRNHDNLSAAVRWAIDHQDTELGLRLAASLSYFWYFRGHHSEGRGLRAAVLAFPAGPGLATLRVAAIQGEGLLAILQGDYAAARTILEEGVAMGRAGERGLLPPLLATLGFATRVQEEYDVARAALDEAIEVARADGNTFYYAMALHHRGLLTLEADCDLPRARALNEEALAIFGGLGNRRMVGVVQLAMGRIAHARADLSEARALTVEAIALFSQIGDFGNISLMLCVLAGIDADIGQVERAVRLTGAAASLNEAMGTRTWPVVIRERDVWLARARAALGEEHYANLWSEGQVLTLDAAIAYALAPTSE